MSNLSKMPNLSFEYYEEENIKNILWAVEGGGRGEKGEKLHLQNGTHPWLGLL